MRISSKLSKSYPSEPQSPFPLTFGALAQENGYVLYETTIDSMHPDPTALVVNGVADRGGVFLDGVRVGTVNRDGGMDTVAVSPRKGQV